MSWRHGRYTPAERAAVRAAKERAGYKCEECGSGYKVQAHHKVRLAAGGATTLENLQVLCFDCHRAAHRKTGYELSAWFRLVDERQYGSAKIDS